MLKGDHIQHIDILFSTKGGKLMFKLVRKFTIVMLVTLIGMFSAAQITTISVHAHENKYNIESSENVETTEEDIAELRSTLGSVEAYIDMDGDQLFNEELARQNNESQEVIEAGLTYNDMILTEQGALTSRSIIDYGNWCGPGDKGSPPIDTLDRQCQKHDKCYEQNGWGNTKCDINLVHNIASNFGSIKGTGAQAYAIAAIMTFAAKVGGTTALAIQYPILAPFLP